MTNLDKIGFGGGCHWCTEAVFQALHGVVKVEQGYISSYHENTSFSEGIVVHFCPEKIPLDILIEIHLRTHKSTSTHSMREKYRSAVYTFSQEQSEESVQILKKLQYKFEKPIITKILSFRKFQTSRKEIQNYYQNNPEKPFCKKFIDPKLEVLKDKFPENLKQPGTETVENILKTFSIGHSEVWYLGKRYGVSKTEFNDGNSMKLYAAELGGKNFISLNFYKTQNSVLLKPCEMPVNKVLHFLKNFKLKG